MRLRCSAAAAPLVLWSASVTPAQDIPRGTLIEDIKCAADATESYALYVPSTYAAVRNGRFFSAGSAISAVYGFTLMDEDQAERGEGCLACAARAAGLYSCRLSRSVCDLSL